MSIKKTFLTNLLAIGVGSLSVSAFAADLTIINNTNHDSTTKTNGSKICSNAILGEDGITRHDGKPKTIKEWQLKLACSANLENCVADVYMTDNCGGDVITTITFSVTTGIKGATPPKQGYKLTYGGFKIQLDGGPKTAA